MIKAILFDLDGVLVDACEWHYVALNSALSEMGLTPIGREDHIKKYNGLPTRQKLAMMGLDIEDIAVISELKRVYTAKLIREKCKPNKKKVEMLKALSEFKLACCSNAIKESVEDMLDRSKILQYFDLVLGNNEIANPKPDPEIYLKAFKELKVKPKDCLIVEDAPHGIEAAKASGATVIAVRGYKDVNIDLFKRLGVI